MATDTLMRRNVRVNMQMINGLDFQGVLIIERTARLSDVLNNASKDFIVLLDDDHKAHIVNKQHIIRITEISESELADI